MDIKAFIFDMDGLLFDSERIVQRSWEIAGDELGIPHMGDVIYHTLGMNRAGRNEYFRKYIREDFPFEEFGKLTRDNFCLLYTSPSPRDRSVSRMPSSA